MRAYVIGLPQGPKPLFEGDLDSCRRFMEKGGSSATTRLALVVSEPRPSDGSDALVCVPAAAANDWEALAAAAIDAWETRWLLIDSAPRRHPDEVRADLHQAIANALLAAAVAGVDPRGRPINDDF